MKCCIYTRLYNESPYINFFLSYYLNLGFSKFIFLKADNIFYNINKIYEPYIIIQKISNLKDELELPKYSYLIRESNCDWVFGCDIDEFIILNKKYKTIQNFIQDKLNSNFTINMFFLRWAQVYKFNNNKESLKDIFTKYKVYSDNDIKSLVKITPHVIMGHPHFFKNNLITNIYIDNEIKDKIEISNKINKDSYQEIFLLHLNIRSLHNLIIKALDNGKKWQIDYTFIKNSEDFNEFLNLNLEDINIEKFIDITGGRLKPAFEKNDSNLAIINFNNFDLTKLDKCYFIDQETENKLLNFILNKYKINIENYNKIINFIDEIYETYFFK